MKTKLSKFTIVLLCLFTFINCGGNKGGSGSENNTENTEVAQDQQEVVAPVIQKHPTVEIEEQIMNLVVEKKYNDAVNLMLKHGDMTNLDAGQVKQAAPFFVQIVKGAYSKNGGLASFEIETPEINDDTKKISLVINETYTNGKTKVQKIRYSLIKGDWKREIAVDNRKR